MLLLMPAFLLRTGGDPLEAERLASGGPFGSRAAPLWAKLRSLLEQYGGPEAGGTARDVLRMAAADAVLRADRRMGLPLWLVDCFMVGPGFLTGAS